MGAIYSGRQYGTGILLTVIYLYFEFSIKDQYKMDCIEYIGKVVVILIILIVMIYIDSCPSFNCLTRKTHVCVL